MKLLPKAFRAKDAKANPCSPELTQRRKGAKPPNKPGDSSSLAVAIARYQTVNTAITIPINETLAALRLCGLALKIFRIVPVKAVQ
ncbi:MAG TPA: hypothetical protein VK815_12660 [Candidatus Acidoferrales bacterium]|jgi:hypothetical protein|nr:hypothetical protein [Candidatus Acidoferrales bacterium]